MNRERSGSALRGALTAQLLLCAALAHPSAHAANPTALVRTASNCARLTSSSSQLSALARPLAAANEVALRRIDLRKVLWGVEYTFQDQAMVDEPGRMTMNSPHKTEKSLGLARSLAARLGLEPEVALEEKPGWKTGWYLNVPDDGQFVVNSEPVTIEVNTTPKTLDDVNAISPKIFASAGEVQLKPYVQPAAERSGMGHVHVGGRTLGDSPFYQHPNLLRNLMAYEHQHPSLLYGFAEAYDVGSNSNIEAFHSPTRQKLFRGAIADFDAWYTAASDKKDGLRRWVQALYTPERRSDLVAHYRFINLEHMRDLNAEAVSPAMTGKITAELRNLRPPKSPAHLDANLRMLARVMENLSEPGRLVPVPRLSPARVQNFFSVSKVEADWIQVKKEMGLADPLLDEQIAEYVENLRSRQVSSESLGAKIAPAYSEKTRKDTLLEITIPAGGKTAPLVHFQGAPVELERILLPDGAHWLGVVDLSAGSTPQQPLHANTVLANPAAYFSRP